MASRRVVWWLLGLAASTGVAPVNAVAAPASAPVAAAPARSEPKVQRTVIEDDHVKIEELRVRGQLQRITISPKAAGVRPYEIAPPDSGRDPSQQSKGISGHSLWQLFSF
ncbi:MAG: hypothetical protein LKCHEGNO_02730 [Burkholderiaceae bacterium]|nr:hypothetical protein [Burkholderiaceae bacterium]